jgi:putative DNA-invertase from lambdoid prophage Rac
MAAGREAARAALAATGKTQHGKLSLGKTHEAAEIASWRAENAASISQTATHFGLSAATVKRACAVAKIATRAAA